MNAASRTTTLVLLSVFVFLFTLQSALSVEVVTGHVNRWEFDNDLIDTNNTQNLSSGGSLTYNTNAIQGTHSLDVDAINSYVYGKHNLTTATDSDRSVCFWLYSEQDSDTITQYALSIGNYPTNTLYGAYHFQLGHGPSTTIDKIAADTHGEGVSEDPSSYASDRWHHFCAVYTASNDSSVLYHNGSQVASGTYANPPVGLHSDAEIVVGCTTQGGGSHGCNDARQVPNVLIDDVRLYDYDIPYSQVETLYLYPNGTAAAPSNATDAMFTESAFSEQFTDVISIGAAYGTVASTTFEVTESAQPTYYGATITTNGTGGDTTAQCRLNLDGSFYGSTKSRSISDGTLGNFRLTTSNVTLTPGNYSLTAECQKTGGPGYSVTGTTITGHLLYDTDRDVNITYDYADTGSITLPSGYSPVYNLTFTTGQNYNGTGTNTPHIIVEGRASPTYTTAGNVSLYLEIGGERCGNYTRYGGAGSTGSIGLSCARRGFTNGTAYTITLNAKGDATLTTQLHVKEFVVHNNTVNWTTLDRESVTSATLTNIATLTIENLIGNNYNIISQAGTNIQTNSTSTTASLVLNQTSVLRENLRTLTTSGQPGNVYSEGIFTATGVPPKTLALMASCVNSNCMIEDGEFTAYATDTAGSVTNTFTIYAYDFYNGTTIEEFNATILGATFTTTNGTISIVTNQTNPVVTVTGIDYFDNVTAHDRTNDLNTSLVKYTKVTVQQLDASPISNFSALINGTGTYQTEEGVLFLPLEGETYNVSVYNLSEGGTYYADQSVTATANPYLQTIVFTVLLSNTFNVTFVDEITELPVTENVTFEVISDVFAQNYTVTNTSQFNVSLLTPSEYTLRFRSASYTERDYIVDLVNGSFYTINLYMIKINDSSDVAVTVEDTSGERVENATVILLRYFVTCNCYRAVEMSKTSPSGEAVFWVQAIEGFYKWSINYLGQNEFLSTSPENILTDTRVFTINLGDNFYESYTGTTSIGSSIGYNQANGALTFTWSDPGSITNQGCLKAEFVNGTKWSTLGPSCVNGTSGSVVLLLDNTTRYKYEGYVDTTTGLSHVLVSGWIDNILPGYDFGNVGAFLAAGLIMGLSLLFSFSAIAVVIINVVGVLAISFMEIVPFQTSFIVGLAALAIGFGAYLMRR